MQIGVRELKAKLSEVVNGNRPVTVTNNGRVLGEFTPATIVKPSADRAAWLDHRIEFRRKWQEANSDWMDLLNREGLDEEGEPFGEPTFR